MTLHVPDNFIPVDQAQFEWLVNTWRKKECVEQLSYANGVGFFRIKPHDPLSSKLIAAYVDGKHWINR